MSYDWGPHFIVPSEGFEKFSGSVLLRENIDDKLLRKELETLGLKGAIEKINNPWYYRKKDTESWIKIGESDDVDENFPVRWDTSMLENGTYEVLGFMHVHVKEKNVEKVISRQRIVDVTIEH
jgi:hypothetical protein